MAQKPIVHLSCDRCGKDEYTDAALKTSDTLDLQIQMVGMPNLIFKDLCSKCKRIALNNIERIKAPSQKE